MRTKRITNVSSGNANHGRGQLLLGGQALDTRYHCLHRLVLEAECLGVREPDIVNDVGDSRGKERGIGFETLKNVSAESV